MSKEKELLKEILANTKRIMEHLKITPVASKIVKPVEKASKEKTNTPKAISKSVKKSASGK